MPRGRDVPSGSETTHGTKGELHEIKGTAKEVVGKITGDPALEAEGAVEKTLGKVQKKVGKLEKVFEK